MIYANNENINTDKYGEIDSGSSVSLPVGGDKIGSILNSIATNSSNARGLFSKSVTGEYNEDKALTNSIEEWYSRALDLVGLNFSDPIQAYGTHFNKNMQTLGLDPQRPGNSYAFFTRPDLNLVNLDKGKGITPFFDYILTTEIGNYVAEYLQYPNSVASRVSLDNKYKTDSPFDPLKTNMCKEVSGLKDIVLDSFETVGDFTGHQLSYATGSDGYDSIGEVTVTFEDTTLSPIFLSHYLLIQYIHEVARGNYWPKYEYLANRIIDYTISIYLFKLAEDNMTILRWGKLTGCYPISLPLNTLNHSRESKIDEFDDISITYKYNFYEPMDPRVFMDFNKLTYPLAMQNGSKDMFDINAKLNTFGSLELKDPSHPERLLAESPELLTRADSIWGKYPLVIGNKLIFV